MLSGKNKMTEGVKRSEQLRAVKGTTYSEANSDNFSWGRTRRAAKGAKWAARHAMLATQRCSCAGPEVPS